eukprot:TRINITY_DN25229_c0_g1_i1.p1 TRINITY_DN25229_c0_g1~~TRINITY_DN25229_c0_g1_i1.p1  ORF type:complete len:695 (+),score=186.55 TRINITY_DN25229_c0_g1_i1:43-2085(+)
MLHLLGVLAVASLRAPAYPLAVQDPYMSIWSPYDTLNGGQLMRWNGRRLNANGLVRVDGNCYTWLGGGVSGCTAATQSSVDVKATQTTYVFTTPKVKLTVTFRTPRVMRETMDWTRFALPLTYVEYSAVSLDRGSHKVGVYFDMGGDIAVNNGSHIVEWSRTAMSNASTIRLGNADQVFNCGQRKCIDDTNWGYLHFGYTPSAQSSMGVSAVAAHEFFKSTGGLPGDSTVSRPAVNGSDIPVLAVAYNMTVGTTQTSEFMTLGYDQQGSMKYFGTLMYGLWKNVFKTYGGALDYAIQNRDAITEECNAFDAELTQSMTAAGNEHYAEMGSLAYRQVTGATVTVWNPVENVVWVFMKEISSDGDISTVDVIFPATPFLLYYSAEFTRVLLTPVMEYALNQTAKYGMDVKYNLAWAPHHLGVWPVCDQTPESQEQMPVEETGNILLMIATYVKSSQDLTWLAPYWTQLDSWATYLTTVLPDPGNQLCTDDFEGPSPHNANLAVKGILALDAYASLLKQKGDTTGFVKYNTIAATLSKQWVGNATDGDGTHTKLQYDLQGSWSQKYNIYFQYALGLSTIPQSVVTKEWAHYELMQNDYGIPLDDRASFTKVDWSFWCGAFGTQAQFLKVVELNYKWLVASPQRVPWSDWVQTENTGVAGFRARPVIGGIWSKMLTNKLQGMHK